MSYRQSLWVLHPVAVDAYLRIVQVEFGAIPHPAEPRAFLIDAPPVPFYRPQLLDGAFVVMGFNHVPLSRLLLSAFIIHPELAPPQTRIRWTEEQELVVADTLEQLGRRLRGKEC
jgi:hypothetical protein